MPNVNGSLDTVSNEMEEIVGRIPPWIIRWGITVLFVVAIIGAFISSHIRFPDSIQGTVVVQARQQPGKVTVQRNHADQQYHFYVKDGQIVKPGDTLLVSYHKNKGTSEAITTPMTGKIYVVNGRNSENLLEQTIWVIPNSQEVDVKIKYPNKGAGNVKKGQSVRIALDDYPDYEYGFLEGQIESILPIQTENTHEAKVTLFKRKLLTSQGKELPILPLMEGNGEILLNDRSIFQRIFNSILR